MDSEKKVNDANMGRSNHLRTQKSVIDGGGNVNRIEKLLSRQILGQSVVFTAHLPSMSILGQRQTQYYPLRRERMRLN